MRFMGTRNKIVVFFRGNAMRNRLYFASTVLKGTRIPLQLEGKVYHSGARA